MTSMYGNSQDGNSRIAFIIWTPLHLFNTLRFILSRDLVGKCDAFYMSQSEGMEIYYNNIESEHIFNRVFYSNAKNLKKNQYIWETTAGLLHPSLYVKHMFGDGSVENHYNQIFMSVPTRLNDAIIRANESKEVVGFDDGIGSYTTNLYDSPRGKYDLVRKIMRKDTYHIRRAFVNNPEIVIHTDSIAHEKLLLRQLTAAEDKQIKQIFGFEKAVNQSKYVYLNQPLKEVVKSQDYIQVEKSIIDTVKKEVGRELSVRMHPRELDKGLYTGIKMEDNTQMWEMICNEEIMDEIVLISSFSTAQFTPKFFFNKEPWVIFTLNMYDDFCEKQSIIEAEKMIHILRDSYTDAKRVISVNRSDELAECLRYIKNPMI